jgi:hypothetical protein
MVAEKNKYNIKKANIMFFIYQILIKFLETIVGISSNPKRIVDKRHIVKQIFK